MENHNLYVLLILISNFVSSSCVPGQGTPFIHGSARARKSRTKNEIKFYL